MGHGLARQWIRSAASGAFLSLGAAMLVAPAMAQEAVGGDAEGLTAEERLALEQLDVEVSGSTTEAGALNLASGLEASGNFSGASVVLERYLLVDSESVAARAEYARLLCVLDDKGAGAYELAKLRAIPADAATLASVEKACGV